MLSENLLHETADLVARLGLEKGLEAAIDILDMLTDEDAKMVIAILAAREIERGNIQSVEEFREMVRQSRPAVVPAVVGCDLFHDVASDYSSTLGVQGFDV
jgi:hypothetical protein